MCKHCILLSNDFDIVTYVNCNNLKFKYYYIQSLQFYVLLAQLFDWWCNVVVQNEQFLFRVVKVVMHIWDIQRHLKKQDNKPSGAENNQEDFRRNPNWNSQRSICYEFLHECKHDLCLYFNLVTFVTGLCHGLRARAMYIRHV